MLQRVFLLLALGIITALPLTAQKIRVACVGNSITYGSGIAQRDSLSYPAQLQRMLGDDFEVRNFGVSGRTLLKKGDHPYWQEKAFDEVQAWKPHMVVIMLGTNDTKPQNWQYGDEFESDYHAFLQVFKSLSPTPAIWAALPVPIFKANRYHIRDSVLQLELPIIRRVAASEKVKLLDLHTALENDGQYFPDGVHPDKDGAGDLAKAVYAALQEALSSVTIHKR